MDVFSRVIAAPRIDLGIALSATALALAIGTAIGGIAGYFRTWWSEMIMRISDLVQSFPVFILAMVLVTITGQEIWIVVVVIAFVNVPLYVRMIRAELVSLRERTFVEAAVVLGVPPLRIIRRHLIPNVLGIIINQASITMGVAMLLTAGLSFVGAGVRVPTARMGAHDRDRRPEHRDRTVVAVRLSGHRAVALRLRVRPVRRRGGPDARQPGTRGMNRETLPEVAVRGLTVEFPSRAGTVRTLDDVTLDIGRGRPSGWSGRAGSESRSSCGRS